jgi:internalin A
MDEDFISYSKYACICEKKTISEEPNQEQLIDLLHRLGLVLSFRDHPILQSTNVLNPDWVTQGIYALLSDEILKTKTKGMLTYQDLSRILDPQRYPAKRHHYLAELMKEFQLCFQVPIVAHSPFSSPDCSPKMNPKIQRSKAIGWSFNITTVCCPKVSCLASSFLPTLKFTNRFTGAVV